jgi:hypothetical protein
MYKSSTNTNFQKYFFPILILLMVLLATVVHSGPDGYQEFLLIVIIWSAIFLVQAPFRLKNIKADDKGVTIKGAKSENHIEYRNVISVSKFDLAGPHFITLKYFDPCSGSDKKVCYIPDHKDKRSMDDDAMSSFIKSKARVSNANYVEKSAFKNFAILLLLAVPTMAVAFYFLNQNLQLM